MGAAIIAGVISIKPAKASKSACCCLIVVLTADDLLGGFEVTRGKLAEDSLVVS